MFLRSETIAHSMDLPRPGWAEMDAEATWWAEVCAIAGRLTAQIPSGGTTGRCLRQRRRAVSGVVRRRLCGRCARRSCTESTPGQHAEIDSLTAEFGADAILEQAGTALSSQAVGPKLEWVRRHEPEVFEKAAGWYGSNSYIAAKLTGEYVMDHHTASQCDPLYATRAFEWNRPLGATHLRSSAAAAAGLAR